MRRRAKRPCWKAVALALALCGLACARSEEGEAESVAEAPAPSAVPEPAPDSRAGGPQAAPAAVSVSRKLVRTVDLEIEVRDPEKVSTEVQGLAGRLGGYVASVDAQRLEDGTLYSRMTLRVPVERLDEALSAIRKLAVRVEREQQRVEDVTDRFVDLEARLRTLRATEAELQALLAESRQKARKVEEIMAVYRELTEIRSQIEQIEGQRNALNKLASLSTINLALIPTEGAKPVTDGGWRPGETVRASVRTLVAILRGLGTMAIYLVVVFLPLALLAGLLVWLVRRVWRRMRPADPGPPFAPPPPDGGPAGPPPGRSAPGS